MSPRVSATDLADELVSDAPPVVLDVRWRLDGTEGEADYLREHVPGAVYVDLETELTRHGEPADGRHPMPTLAVLQAAVRRWGLNAGDRVVVLDGGLTLAAARAWWLLDGADVDVRVLDGGMRAWRAEGLATASGAVARAPGTLVVHRLPESLDIDAAASFPTRGTLLDVRAPERFRGEVEPLDPIAGHIPGAVNLPSTELVAPDGTFRSATQLASQFAAVSGGADGPLAAYCGSGITAAMTALAARIAGRTVVVYPGSWSAWSNTPGRPIATGA